MVLFFSPPSPDKTIRFSFLKKQVMALSKPKEMTTNHLSDVHIVLTGLIGAGKTTLAKNLSLAMGLTLFEEHVVNNELLENFYRDQATYATALQFDLLAARYLQQFQFAFTKGGTVQDRSIYEDRVFARMLVETGIMKQADFDAYCKMFDALSITMPRPSVLVHLEISPKESLKRIKKRNRPMERGITLEYLTELHSSYSRFIKEISKVIPVIVIDWSVFHNADAVVAAIKDKIYTSNIQHIGQYCLPSPRHTDAVLDDWDEDEPVEDKIAKPSIITV